MIKIKQLVNNQAKFSFQPVSVHTVKEVVKVLPSNKAIAGEIPIKILKENGFDFEYLTSCVNEAISSSKFSDSDSIKPSNIVSVHKKKDPTDKCYYRSVSILPLLSTLFEKILHDQLYTYINNFLYDLLCGFRNSTQHILFKECQKELDNSGFIRTIPMGFIGTIPKDLPKAYDCLLVYNC